MNRNYTKEEANEFLMLSSYFFFQEKYKDSIRFPLTKINSLEILFEALLFSKSADYYLDTVSLVYFSNGMKKCLT
jgi:hypothetical protein